MRIFQVDAFTRTRFFGNPATVVLDADGQPDSVLQAIAREFSHAETAFVSAATAPDHDVRVRFFNARKEAAFVGHATIAAHAVLAALGRRPLGRWRQLSGTGIVEVLIGAAAGRIEFRQSAAELDAPLPFQTTLRVATALGVPAGRLHATMPARVARKGGTRLLLPVEALALDGIAPNVAVLVDLGAEIGADGFFVFALDRRGEELRTESRMFCPALGIPEDPVSGNAHGMLAAYLWDLGQIGPNSHTFIGHQGERMRRPGEVSVRLEIVQARLQAVSIGGHAVIVSEGTLAL